MWSTGESPAVKHPTILQVYADSDRWPGLRRLALGQDGVATRTQLERVGCSRAMLRAQLDGRRWSAWGAGVIALHNHALSRHQLMWAAVLDAGTDAALCSHTALELAGFKAFAREAAAVHLLVPRGAKVSALPAVVVHESRRVQSADHITRGIRRTASARSAVDAGAWQRWPRFACAMVAAVVQQGLASADDIDEALRRAGRVRHKAHLRAVLSDVQGGLESSGELDVITMCRRFSLIPPPRRQVRLDLAGQRRYLDAEWDLPDGTVVVLEVDGRHHLDVAAWQDDIRRERAVVVTGRRVLRATTVELRVEPEVIATDLLAIGVPRVVRS